MDWLDKENRLKYKLKNYRVDTDTNKLWGAISTKIPQKKNRNALPLVFVLGVLLGGLAMSFWKRPCAGLEDKEQLITTLQQELKWAQNQILRSREKDKSSIASIANDESHRNNIKEINRYHTSAINEVSFNNRNENKTVLVDTLSKTSVGIGAAEEKQKIKVLPPILTTLPEIIFKTNNSPCLDPKMDGTIKTQKIILPNTYTIGAGFGIPFTSIEGAFDRRYIPQPMHALFLELGYRNRISSNLHWGFDVCFNSFANRYHYLTTSKTNIIVQDTSEIYIDQQGIKQYESSEINALKITTSEGRIHSYNTIVSFNPRLSYSFYINKNWALSLNGGFNYHVLDYYKGVVAINDKAIIISSGKRSSGIISYQVGWHVDNYRQQKLRYSITLHLLQLKRNFALENSTIHHKYILPSAGIRICI